MGGKQLTYSQSYDPRATHPDIAKSNAAWQVTYAKFGAAGAISHPLRVQRDLMRLGVVEEGKIGDKKADPEQFNIKIININMPHLFLDKMKDFPVEHFWKYTHVVKGFEDLVRLRSNDLGSQDPVEYVRILERPSLGLLARMVDITQYGRDGPASEKELANLDPKIFYHFDKKTGKTEYEQIALAARKVYAPIADLLQYRALAGELMSISYYHLDRGIYETVKRTLQKLQGRIEATKKVMGALKDELERHLRRQGYDYTLITRERKHPGKVMEKAERRAREHNITIEEQIPTLNDLVAFTIVLHSRNGRTITQDDITEFENVASMVTALTASIKPLKSGIRQYEMFHDWVTNPKPNGYQSFHVDMPFEDSKCVGLEVIIRNSRMHQYADTGGAAHYLYKGGGNEARIVQKGYRNVLHGLLHGTTSHLSLNDYRNSRNVLFVIDGRTPRQYVVPSSASVGEALVCAGMDMTRRIWTKPEKSMLVPLGDMDTFWAWHGEPREQTVAKSLLHQLIHSAILDSTRDRLLEMRKRIDKHLRG